MIFFICYNRHVRNSEALDTPANPAELAATWSDIVLDELGLVNTPREAEALAELYLESENLGFNNKCYFVKANRSFFIPLEFKREEPVKYTAFDELLMFRGVLTSFTIVKAGKLAGNEHAVRCLCLAFSPIFFLSGGSIERERQHILHTPALAVNDIVEQQRS